MVSQIGNRPPRRGLVLGCGGTLGAAWTLANLVEVERALGWDARTADVIVGTSAGSELAMLLGAGVATATILAAALGERDVPAALAHRFAHPPPAYPPRPTARPAAPGVALARGATALTRLTALLPVGRGDPAFLDALVDAHVAPGGWVAHPATWIVTVDLATGQRVAFGAPGAPPAAMRDAVRASWAVPTWFPPVAIGGRRYVDGGVASPASADLLAARGLDEVIVLAPMASSDPGPRTGLGRIEGVVRRAMTRTLDAEVARVRAAGVPVLRLEPDRRDLVALGPNFMDRDRRHAALEACLIHARASVVRACARDRVGPATTARVRSAS
ncbi:MAG: patatin-like phospholipase family protein [Myxococcales bacterium]|nr:patatin-like phospholipase family protein [Myxococcales bacterium]